MKAALVSWIRKCPGFSRLIRSLRFGNQPLIAFEDSAGYWRQRYAAGGDSGAGSYGKFAQFKARVLNQFFVEQTIDSVIEFGSGDGNQLALLEVPDYLGVDISVEVVERCRTRFAGHAGRAFMTTKEYTGQKADCALSLDVIYHLVEDSAFEAYMTSLFAAARGYVVIYSSNRHDAGLPSGDHVRHRIFTDWVSACAPGWKLWRHIPNEFPFSGDWRTGSFADFYIFQREESGKLKSHP